MALASYFDGSYQGAAAQRKAYEDYNKLTREQKKAVMKRQAAYDQERNNQYNIGRGEAQIGSEGAGPSMYEYMGQNAANRWERGIAGQMAQDWVRQPAQQAAPQRDPAAEAMAAGKAAWSNWKSPTQMYDDQVNALYKTNPQANPQAAVAGRVAAPSQFAGASGIYGRF